MVTSRVVLSLRDEITFLVPPLGLPSGTSRDEVEDSDACTLFVERARAVRPGFRLSDADAAVVADVCELLDGLPLAIELAAARIKLFTPEQLRLRLHTRLAGPRRRRCRRARSTSGDACHDRLELPVTDPAEQVFFRDLAVFRGGATLDAIAQVVAADDDAIEPLTALVNHNLVRQTDDEHGEMRFDLLHVIRRVRPRPVRHRAPTPRTFGTAIPAITFRSPKPSAPPRRRHDACWRVRKPAIGPRLAARPIRPPRRPRSCRRSALRLANTLGRFWYRHGHLQEGVARFEHALAVASDVDEMQRATALRHLGTLLETRRDVRAARACLEEALAICRRRGDRACEAGCLNSLGIVARTAGDLARAETNFLDSLALRRELDDVAGTATTLSNLALVVMDRDQSRPRPRAAARSPRDRPHRRKPLGTRLQQQQPWRRAPARWASRDRRTVHRRGAAHLCRAGRRRRCGRKPRSARRCRCLEERSSQDPAPRQRRRRATATSRHPARGNRPSALGPMGRPGQRRPHRRRHRTGTRRRTTDDDRPSSPLRTRRGDDRADLTRRRVREGRQPR